MVSRGAARKGRARIGSAGGDRIDGEGRGKVGQARLGVLRKGEAWIGRHLTRSNLWMQNENY